MKTVSVKLPAPMADWLARRAKETKRTRSALVRDALERERSGKGQSRSCHDRLQDVCGSFFGPADLSTNPKHMEGFGR